AGHAPSDRDVLLDAHRHTAVDAIATRERLGSLQGQVARVGRDAFGRRTADLHRPVVGLAHGDVVVDADGVEHGRELVVAVLPARTDDQLEVDLAGDTSGHTAGFDGQAHVATL